MIWKETLAPKSVEPKPETQTDDKSPSIEYLTFDDEDAFELSASAENLYKKNKNGFRANLDDFINLYKTSTYAESTKRGECRDTAELYISLVNNMIEDSFGDPNSSDLEDYKIRSKYWYGFLILLMTIKSRLKKCYANKVDFGDLANELSSIPKTGVWGINIVSREPEKFDKIALNAAKQNLPENRTIRKKLIEYKEMKTIKESVKQKLLLKLEDKNKKIDKISENLYKIAGDFYGGNYDRFYNKYNKLVETYKNSKMFLVEDSQQSFSNALVKVFKGDEDKFIGEAIPWFINKLGLEGNVASQVESELRRKYGSESDMSSLFSDDWSDVVVSAVKDNAKSDISEPSTVMDALEKVMMSNLDSSDFDYKLKREISKMLRPAQDEKKTKIQDLANQIKKSILDQGSES
jgi:hypothetical protein